MPSVADCTGGAGDVATIESATAAADLGAVAGRSSYVSLSHRRMRGSASHEDDDDDDENNAENPPPVLMCALLDHLHSHSVMHVVQRLLLSSPAL